MNARIRHLLRIHPLSRICAALCTAAILASPMMVFAQDYTRLVPIPVGAQYGGRMTHVQGLQVWLNDQYVDLAPGVTIHDARNFMVLPIAVPANTPIRYITDLSGQISRIWLLSDDEAQVSGRPNIRR